MSVVRKLSKDDKPPVGDLAWFWRNDDKRWHVVRMTRSIEGWIGNPELAYTYWSTIKTPPKPE